VIPKKEENIYPKSKENIRALIDYYFLIPDGEIDFLFEQKKLSLNQIEFIANKVSKYIHFFEMHLDNMGMNVGNLIKYGIAVFSEIESEWEGDDGRKKITYAFKEYVIKNDDDVSYVNN